MAEKICSSCGTSKPLDKFKRSGKCSDGHVPYCSRCQYVLRLKRYMQEDQVAHRLWRELSTIVKEQQNPGATEIKMSKDIFTIWLFSSPKWERMYSQYCSQGMDLTNPSDFHIKSLNKNKALDFDNIDFEINNSGKFMPSATSSKL